MREIFGMLTGGFLGPDEFTRSFLESFEHEAAKGIEVADRARLLAIDQNMLAFERSVARLRRRIAERKATP